MESLSTKLCVTLDADWEQEKRGWCTSGPAAPAHGGTLADISSPPGGHRAPVSRSCWFPRLILYLFLSVYSMLRTLLLVREATQSQGALPPALAPLIYRLAPMCAASSSSSSSALTFHTSTAAGSSAASNSSSAGDSPDVFTASLAAKTEEELRQLVMKQGHSVAAAAEADDDAAATESGRQQAPSAGASQVRKWRGDGGLASLEARGVDACCIRSLKTGHLIDAFPAFGCTLRAMLPVWLPVGRAAHAVQR